MPAPLYVMKGLRVCFKAGCVATGDKWPPTIRLGRGFIGLGESKILEVSLGTDQARWL